MKINKLEIILISLVFSFLSADAQWQKVSQVYYSGCGWDLGISFNPGYNSFDFVNDRIGYITVTESCGGPGTYDPTYLLKSSDWGASWEHIYTTGHSWGQYSSLAFSFYEVDSAYLLECNDGLCSGIDYSGNYIGVSTEPPIYIKSFSQDSLVCIDWIDMGEYWGQAIIHFNPLTQISEEIVITNNYELVYQNCYSDRGPVVKKIYFSRDINLITAKDSSNNTLVFWSGMDWTNWQETNLPSKANPTDIKFITDSVGFILDNDSCIYRTTDRCESWELIPVPTNEPMRKIEFTKNAGYIICKNGVVLETNDLGNSWHTISFPSNNDLIDIASASDSVLYILDEKLNIFCNKSLINSIDSEPTIDQNIQVYPLPTNNWIIISLNEAQIINSISIYNIGGNLVYSSEDMNTSEVKVSLDNLSNGIYFIRALTEDEIYSTKIIKH